MNTIEPVAEADGRNPAGCRAGHDGVTLVTGGTGFIGSHLVTRLRSRGERIRCVAKHEINAASLEEMGTEVILGDLNGDLDLDSVLDGVDRVFHLAGVTRAHDTSDYYEGNVHATARLIDACVRHASTIRRLVYVSSLAAVGPAPDLPIDEDFPCRPVSHYGRSKLLGEKEVLKARDRMAVTIVRPSAVYGPRDSDFLKYFRLVKHRLRLIAGLTPRRLSLIHVDDLIDGLILAGEHHRAANEVFFIADEDSVTTEQFALEVASAMGIRTLGIHVPAALVFVTAAIVEATGKLAGQDVLFNRQKARELVQPRWICSVAKAVERLGFCPRVSLSAGVRATLDWYLKAHWL